jgi:hypothetical protein
MTSAWAGWSRFDIPVDRYGGVHSQLICTSRTLRSPTCHQASQQENTYCTKYQKADRASTLVTLWCSYYTSITLDTAHWAINIVCAATMILHCCSILCTALWPWQTTVHRTTRTVCTVALTVQWATSTDARSVVRDPEKIL